jgi:hypothetical protein
VRHPLENTARVQDLLSTGLTPHELRQSHWRHPYHGLARIAGEDEGHPLTRILDAVPLLPPCGCIGGWASLYLHGIAYIDGVDRAGNEQPVLLHTCERHRIRRRSGIEPTRTLLLPGEVTAADDRPATVIARAAYDQMCRAGSLTEAVVVLDMSISRVTGGGRTTLASVRRLVERHRKTRGIRLARAAIDLATDRSASPRETRTRLVVMIELPIADLAVNQPIFDTAGRLIGIPDLLDPATELVVETDGSAHRRLGQRSRDHGRDDRFESCGLTVVRITPQQHGDRSELVRRLRAGYDRARRRSGTCRGWTHTRPEWWAASSLARRWG